MTGADSSPTSCQLPAHRTLYEKAVERVGPENQLLCLLQIKYSVPEDCHLIKRNKTKQLCNWLLLQKLNALK